MSKRSLWKLILIFLSVAVCAGAALWPEDTGQIQALAATKQSMETAKANTIKVYVNGAVLKPGIYELPANCRAEEAIVKAGGLTNLAAVDKVNLARLCKDGTQIRVPEMTLAQRRQKGLEKAEVLNPLKKGVRSNVAAADAAALTEKAPASASEAGPKGNRSEKPVRVASGKVAGEGDDPGEAVININTAGEEQLCTLPGVGPATAARIIAYRQNHAFQRIEDLQKVKGIGPAKFKKLAAYIAI